MTHFKLRYAAVLAAWLLASGCVGVPVELVPAAKVQSEAPADKPLRVAGLSQKLVFEYLLGDLAARRGKPVTAADAMTRAAELSGDERLVLHAFSLSMEADRFEQALAMSELMEQLIPSDPRARTMRLQALIALERADETFEVVVAFLKAMPEETASTLQHLAEVLSRQDDPSRWLPLLARATSRYADLPEAHFAYAWLAYRAGDTETADRALAQAMVLKPGWEKAALLELSRLREQGQRERVHEYAKDYLAEYPDRGHFRLTWARLLTEWDEIHLALTHFEKLIEIDPDHNDALFAAGILNLDLDEHQRAREQLVHFLELAPEEDRARLYLARIASELENYDEALEWLEQIQSLQFHFDAQVRIGFVLADAGRFEQALEHLADIVPKTQEQQVRVYLAREQVLRDSDQPQAALKLLDAALLEIPDDPDLLYSRGLVTAMLHMVDRHERDMRQLIALEPDNAHAYNALGYTLADQTDRYDEALELIRKALELLPDDPFILDSMGWLQYRMGNLVAALEYLQQAIDQSPDAEIAAHLGEVLWMTGAKDEARTTWRDGKNTDPGNPVLIDTLRKFGQ